MPRPKKAGAPEPKRRSRAGCWPCKTRKVKCDETKPACLACQKQGEACDYGIRLNWDGRGKKKQDGGASTKSADFSSGMISFGNNTPRDSPTSTTLAPGQDPYKSVESEGVPMSYKQDDLIPSNGISDLPRPSNDLMIDPALRREHGTYMASAFRGAAKGHPEQQHAQSYKRFRTSGVGMESPAHSDIGSLSNQYSRLSNANSPTSVPPFFTGSRDGRESSRPEIMDPARPHKRLHYQSDIDSCAPEVSMLPPASTFSPLPSEQPTTPLYTGYGSAPLTPVSSNGDDGYRSHLAKLSPYISRETSDPRRLSVNSLLSGPPGIPAPRSIPEVQHWSVKYQDVYSDTTTFGIDRGFKDLDVGKNDDMNAISGTSPVASRAHMELILDRDGDVIPVEFGFGMETSDLAFSNGSYYDKPVAISIPRALEPLPSKLLENPMNLLYFHHFINHTADCLVPHNCSSNPFKSILPQMAVQDDNLLNLLLAYSASHRARLLRQPEPAVRIALWVRDIFPNLRMALDSPSEIISNSNLATAIMLASLEIISPKAFGVEVAWQKHLDTARQMIAARGGPQKVKTASRGDKVSSFLWSWFAYLDVLGSLSGGKANSSTLSWLLDFEDDGENDYQIDCILGFTSKCVRLLATTAELARLCDSERIGSNHEIIPNWHPSEDTINRAEKLSADLSESRLHPAKPCTHMQSTGEAAYQWDSLEMAATNEAFHWAGLVHLHRRILGKPSEHLDVQSAVREIFGALYKVRRGSSAEACLLFPMFTAGCDTQDEKQRKDILERIMGMERVGMTQIHKARALMERVWETGKPWETLVAGEFFG